MSASQSAQDSAFWFRDPRIDRRWSEAPMGKTARFFVLHIAIPGPDRLTVLRQLRPRRGGARVLLLGLPGGTKRMPSKRGKTDLLGRYGDDRQESQKQRIKPRWSGTFGGCCAITSSSRSGSLRLRVSGNQGEHREVPQRKVARVPVVSRADDVRVYGLIF